MHAYGAYELRAAYDAWADADFDPVVQGCDEEDGALGENENIPWLAAVKGGWFATEDISIYLKYSISHGTDFTHIIYPYTDWAFGENSIFRLGARIKVKDEKVSVSVPLMWQVKFDIK